MMMAAQARCAPCLCTASAHIPRSRFTAARLYQVVAPFAAHDEHKKQCTAHAAHGGLLHDLFGAPDLLTLVKACLSDAPTAAALDRTCTWLHALHLLRGVDVHCTNMKQMDLPTFCSVVQCDGRRVLNLRGCMLQWFGQADTPDATTAAVRYRQISAVCDMLASGSAGTQTLRTLGLRNNQLSCDAVHLLTAAMQTHARLTQLDLSRNRLLNAGAAAVAQFAGTSTTLTALNVSCTGIEDAGASQLTNAVLQNTNSQLRQLDVSFNSLIGACAEDLAQLCPQLVWLDVSGLYNMQTGQSCVLASAAFQSEQLEHLVLADLFLGHLHDTDLANFMRPSHALTYLDLSRCHLGCKTVLAIGNALGADTTLRTLHLDGATIDATAAAAIGDALKSNTTLQTLWLNICGIDHAAAACLARGIAANTALRELAVKHNELGIDGTLAFADMMASNTGITALDVGNSDLAMPRHMVSAVIRNQTVRRLGLSWSHLDDCWCTYIACHSATLTDIDLSSNKIRWTGMSDLVRYGTSLQKLNLHDNIVSCIPGPVAADGIERIDIGDSAITHLVLSDNYLFTRSEQFDSAVEVCQYLARLPALTRLDLSINGQCTARCMAALAPLLGASCRLTSLDVHNPFGHSFPAAAADTLAELTAPADKLSELHVDTVRFRGEQGTCNMLMQNRRSPFRVLTAGALSRHVLSLHDPMRQAPTIQ